MQYHINAGLWGSVFALPSALVDQHIKLCGGVSFKVILLIFRNSGEPIDVSDLASRLNLSPSDVADALSYWVEAGVLLAGEEEGAPEPDLAPSSLDQPKKSESPAGSPAPALQPSARPRFPREESIAIIEGDRVLKGLLQEAQAILGKTFTSVDMDALVGLYSYYGLSAHYIVTLIHYCNSIGKRSMAYVEKTAASWMEEGVDDRSVDDYVDRLTKRKSNEGKVRAAFGIGDRRLAASEQKMIDKWFEGYGFSLEMIQAAYEITVERTGKLAFKYLDTILSSWRAKGITTPEQAAAEQKAPAPGAKQQPGGSYDYDQFSRMVLDNFMKE